LRLFLYVLGALAMILPAQCGNMAQAAAAAAAKGRQSGHTPSLARNVDELESVLRLYTYTKIYSNA